MTSLTRWLEIDREAVTQVGGSISKNLKEEHFLMKELIDYLR